MNEDKQELKEKKTITQKILTIFPLLSILGLILGALGGYIYYIKVGCTTGSCAITSNPWISTLWGALMGYLVFDMFKFYFHFFC